MPKASLHDRLYRILLLLYPGVLRRRYGSDMEQLFRDRRRQAGPSRKALLALWMQAILDVGTQAAAERVREEFLHAWNAYKKYAWGHDILKPHGKSYQDWHEVPIYLTPIDALDTMELMGLIEEADSVREFLVNNLSFDQDIYVKNFEMTIRVLGGLLSAYQMTQDIRLLDLAKDLGCTVARVDRLMSFAKSEPRLTGADPTVIDVGQTGLSTCTL